jgi:hypothetical protein
MRRISGLLLVVVAAVAVMGITREQSLVGSVLTTLKLESVPAKGGLIGGPQEYKVTQATVDHLQKLLKDGKTLVIDAKGELKVQSKSGK